ncbi:subtilisin-like protein [Daedalea quercina L-15889]|uniref:tripeptidyl-peptidase II n=1 Tax=Daedalea quercina L-15889 TaxID=1314783 RepID=A0A165LV11_9APHY|nr:subtilisin-like protein [Daedalea quercina L-15889]
MLLTGRLATSLSLFLFFLALLSSVSGAPSDSSRTVVHESRSHVPRGWHVIRRADPGLLLPFRIGLAQPNIENIETYLLDVSHPSSPNYGKHWTPGRIAETFRPTQESVDAVRTWLIDAGGLDPTRVSLSASGGWLHADMSVEEAERLLETEYHVYQFEGDEARTHVACHEKYHLPEDVAKHVEIVTPTLHFDVKPKSKPVQLEKRDASSGESTSAHAVGQPGFGASFPKTSGTTQAASGSDLAYCDEQIVPDCLRVLYSFNYTPVAPESNTIAIVEYTPQAYVATDLDMFFEEYSPTQVGERPVLNSIDGGFIQTNQTGFDYNGESNLDLQYAMTLVGRTQPVQLYQAGDDVEGASFNNLLDALDASYCYFEGPEACGTVKPAYVMSTSYSYNEADLTPAYEERQCAEYAKLGLLGMTILYSSGDYGVAGNDGVCLYPNGTQAAGAPDFNPTFPGTCPYITSVGATQVNPNSTVYEPESACEQVIYSGGGFSNVFAMPSYQKTAVESYLTKYPPPYSPSLYNSSGTSRGFPDISANGANYVVAVNGEFYLVYGTSCSSPVSATIFSAINDARLATGKGPIGFINPTIYTPEFMAAFNDITTGSNPGCNTEGFYAEPGWDPVTGVGTPNFEKLVALWLELS